MVRYAIAMGIRVICIIACFFVQGWWLLLPIVGAIVLPYVAVVLANVGSNDGGEVLRPGAIVPVSTTEHRPAEPAPNGPAPDGPTPNGPTGRDA